MLGYCPLDDDVVPSVPIKTSVIEGPRLNKEDTECNYLVMFFVIGVLFLAVTDNMRK
jgi:hypothetical protein